MKSLFAGLAAICLLGAPAMAKVDAVSPQGFSVTHTGTIPIAPLDAYNRLLAIGTWWSGDHSFSGDASNFSLEAVAGGCWCEKLPNGGFVKHMELAFASPGEMVVLRGGLGPMLFMGAQSTLTVSFAPAEGGGTTVTFALSVGGYDPDNFTKLSTAVDGVLGEQFTRFITLP